MLARCLVGGCSWVCRDESGVQLALAAELHRAEFHEWCKPGRCHRVDLEPAELELVERLLEQARRSEPSGVRVVGRRPNRQVGA